MATVQVTIPDALIPRITTMARSDAALFRRVTADHWRDLLAGYEVDVAVRANAQDWLSIANAAETKARTDAAGVS